MANEAQFLLSGPPRFAAFPCDNAFRYTGPGYFSELRANETTWD